MKTLTILSALCVLCGFSAQAAESLIYKKAGERELRLHLEKPANWKPSDKRPAIVFYFGGGWVSGTPEQFRGQSESFAARGMVGIRVEYRTLAKGENGPPLVCCADAKSAMRYVRGHAAELGVDPARIAAAGGSAGGHLAAFTAMVEGLDDPADDLKISCKPDALVLFNPVFNNGPGQWGHARVGERFREFSPAHHITKAAPPTCVFLGDADKLIGVPVLREFEAAMKSAGVRCDAHVYPGAAHGFFNREPHKSQTLAEADKFLTSLGWLTAAAAPQSAGASVARPNFIVINIDDLGYADIGPLGSKLNRTPHLDRMAKEGCRLTSFYAAPVCSPSRAALMTGCYAKRALPIPHVLFPEDAVGLSPKEVTVAEVLKEAGYATAIVGKWHLGDQPEFLPNAQGFDLHFGLPYSNDMGPVADGVRSDLGKPIPAPNPNAKGKGQPPLPLLRNGTVVKRVLPDDQQSLVEIYTDEAVKFIAEKKGVPFLLYLPHNAVHFPIYPGRKWAGKSPHGIYSDWVEEVDWSVGRVLDAVREHDLAERTLVIFTSDNGGTPRAVNAPLRGHKGSTLEGGMRVPTIAWWPGKIPGGTATDAITGMFDILPTFAALAGAKLPADRKLDGANIWPHLAGTPDAKPAHDTFFYYNGLRLNAVRHGDWKLQIAMGRTAGPNAERFQPKLYNLRTDIGEATDVSAAHPEIVARLQSLIAAMKADLGTEGTGPGCREPARVENPKPLIPHDSR
jgi:arylsulfatase A